MLRQKKSSAKTITITRMGNIQTRRQKVGRIQNKIVNKHKTKTQKKYIYRLESDLETIKFQQNTRHTHTHN